MCAWPDKIRGCIACGELTGIHECTRVGCKWSIAAKKCSANVKPYNAKDACIDSGGSWDSTASVGSKCTKCSSLTNPNFCAQKPGCFVGRQDGESPVECQSCLNFNKKGVCADQDSCGWNQEEKKCQPCLVFVTKNKCENQHKCAWDARKDNEECTPCADVKNKKRCQDAPSCGWRHSKRLCFVKRKFQEDDGTTPFVSDTPSSATADEPTPSVSD